LLGSGPAESDASLKAVLAENGFAEEALAEGVLLGAGRHLGCQGQLKGLPAAV
jgi:hypothetical protein